MENNYANDNSNSISISKEEINSAALEIGKLRSEIAKRIIGQEAVIDGILTALIANGHVLLEGGPGLAKTLAIKTLSDCANLSFKRIQFTPDLLPADVTGTLVYEQSSSRFTVRKGPIFANLVLADEINRAPAKVQSALLEAMAERQVTIGEETHALPNPFFVLATQNPIEQEGTYPLPEAELDRFLLKIPMNYPTQAEEIKVVMTGGNAEKIPVEKIFSSETISRCTSLAEKINCDESLVNYIVSLVAVTRPEGGKYSKHLRSNLSSNRNRDDTLRYISYGASPRAGIALLKCAKVSALFAGRDFVLPEDIKKMATMVLPHRLVLSYEAAADSVTAEEIVAKILSIVPVP